MQRVVWECDKCGAERMVNVRMGTRYQNADRTEIPDKWAWITISGGQMFRDPEDDNEEEDEDTAPTTLLFCITCKLNITERAGEKQRHVATKRGRVPSRASRALQAILDEGDDE